MGLRTGLELRVYKSYSKAAGELVATLTDRVSSCVATTAVHGGFRQLRFRLGLPLAEAWVWLNRERGTGYHFYHVELAWEKRVVWEGRVMDVTLAVEGGTFQGLDVVCYGYWSSLRDQVYNDNSIDSGSTDWTVGGPHTAADIIKEMLTDKCPDISSDQSHISANSVDLVGITFTNDDYPLDIIVDTLGPGNPDGDESVYHLAVWEDRVPFWTKRAVSEVDYYVWLEALGQARFIQSGHDLRNRVLTRHLIGGATTRTAAADDADSQARYPVRELVVGQGEINATNATNARDQALAEQKLPRQQQSFTVHGRVWGVANAALTELPKWEVRAGKVVRVQDLVPPSVSSPAFDDLRTFFILGTEYDAVTDTLKVQPDRPAARVSSVLARRTPVESRR